MKKAKKNLLVDLFILLISIVFAIWLGTSDSIETILEATAGSEVLGALIGGLFFTSIFTSAPSVVVLGEIAQNSSPMQTAIIGGIGAMIGDLIMFKFLKDRLAKDFYAIFGMNMKSEMSHLRLLRFRWLITLIGAFIIASPFPDELGLAILGFSNTKINLVTPIAFIFNALGILAIGLIAA